MKSKLSKIFVILALTMAWSFVPAMNLVLAEESGISPASGITEENGSILSQGLDTAAKEGGMQTSTTLGAYIGKVLGVALQYLGIIFIILIIYAGIMWMTAGGEPAVVKKATSWMINAVIGLAITLMAYQVVGYIIERIKITS